MSVLLLRRRHRLVPFPSDITGLAAWYKADALALADGAAVSSWTDSSGNGRHAVQATGASQGIFVANGINSLPVVRYDGVDDSHRVTFTLNQPTTTFIVFKLRSTSAGTGKDIYDGGNANSGVFQKTAAPAFALYAGGFVTDGAVDTSAHIFANILNSATSNVRRDGGAGTSGNANVLNPGGVTLGAVGGGTPSLWCDVDIAEFLSYAGSLSIADIDRVGRYLASKYSLAWTTAA